MLQERLRGTLEALSSGSTSAESLTVKIVRVDRGFPKLFGSFAQRTREPSSCAARAGPSSTIAANPKWVREGVLLASNRIRLALHAMVPDQTERLLLCHR
jgi:hypothetical protein